MRRSLVASKLHPFGTSIHGALGSGPSTFSITNLSHSPPLPLPPTSTTHSYSCGWGHTAFIHSPPASPPLLHTTGRPSDFRTLLRLNRLPSILANLTQIMSSTTVRDRTDTMTPYSITGDAIDDIITYTNPDQPSPIAPPATTLAVATTSLLATSAGLTLATSATGHPYTFGVNNYGQCGVGYESNNVWHPTPVLGIHKDAPDIFVTEAMMYSGRKSVLSNTRPTDKQLKKLQALAQTPTISVALGLQHGACVTTSNELYTWGKGERGQMGYYRTGGNLTFAVKVHCDPVDEVVCGFNHVAAAMVGGRVCVLFGKNMQTDSDGKPSDIMLPKPFTFSANVLKIVASSHQTFVKLEDGSVWGHGLYKNGRGVVTSDFIKVFPNEKLEGGEEVDIFGGHDATLVVGKNRAFKMELDVEDLPIEGEGGEELEEAEDWIPHLQPATWLENTNMEGSEIKEVHTGWNFGFVELDQQ